MRARRRLLPWRSRTRRWIAEIMEASPAGGLGGDPLSDLLGLLLFVLLLPLLLLWLLESLAQWIVLPFALIGRLMGVVAVPLVVKEGGHVAHREAVLGWDHARQRLQAIRREIDHGNPHPWRDRSDQWTNSNQPGW